MNEQQLQSMRHSLAHIMAQAVQHLWPQAKFGVGPAIDNGFYYDIDLGDVKISEDDFSRIEKEMRSIIARDLPFTRQDVPMDSKMPISCKRPRTQNTSTNDKTASPAPAAPMVAIVKMF